MDYAIIVAGGKGQRMGADMPKQFLPVGGVPILMRTIKRFRQYSQNLGIIVVLPRDQHELWNSLCEQHSFTEPYIIVDGGETRFHSVRNGLGSIPDGEQGVVGVHDGVRPFTPVSVIAACYDEARRSGSAIPVMPVVETLRHLYKGGGGENVLRSDYRLVQTPQAFDIQLLRQAYGQPYSERFTDDASVVEALGHRVAMVEGDRRNIKITTPFDMTVAEALKD